MTYDHHPNNINNNNNNELILKYLNKEINLNNYYKTFKTDAKCRRWNNNNNNNGFFNFNKNNNNVKEFICKTCRINFKNEMTHDFIMINKCPNVATTTNTTNNFKETIIITDYDVLEKTISQNLEISYKKSEQPRFQFVYTNYLLVKCPICLEFKTNCVIQQCGHCLCRDCINAFIITNDYNKCWICRTESQKSIIFLM